jgi:hypothetical protein
VKKLSWLMICALLLFVIGCSGNAGLTPDDNRVSMEEFFSNLTYDDSVAGYVTVTDADGKIVLEGTLVRGDNGELMLGEVRTGEVIIDLTWLNWVDCSVDYLNPAGFTPDGRSLYYIGTTMEYELNVHNNGWVIWNASVRAEQRYLGGPKNGELLPGASSEEWLHQTLWKGDNIFPDDYYIPYGTLPGNANTWAVIWFPFDFWCIHIDILIFNDTAGVWDP